MERGRRGFHPLQLHLPGCYADADVEEDVSDVDDEEDDVGECHWDVLVANLSPLTISAPLRDIACTSAVEDSLRSLSPAGADPS